MKYMVGYQLMKSRDFIKEIIKNKEHIHEVYFSWSDYPNGRNIVVNSMGFLPWEAQKRQIIDLKSLSMNKIPLNLLFNGNCYGRDSQSRGFFNKIGDTIEYLKSNFGINSITTTSLLIAKFIKSNFAGIEVRASINMSIGSVQGMEYIKEYFDSYYMQRECNRNLKKIKELKTWCVANDKHLYLLANSGCLNNCSAHIFHDNLVSHENEIQHMDNAYEFKGICREYLGNKTRRLSLIRDTNYIRPEDIPFYEQWFDAAKLATRVIKSPNRVLEAYINKKYVGNVLDLLEPNHSDIIYPDILENSRIPKDFCETTLTCNKQCNDCNYCIKTYENAIVKLDGGKYVNQ